MNGDVILGLPLDDYLSMRAVSGSLITTMVTRCPRAAWHESWLNPLRYEDEHRAVMDIGTIAHAILLEGDESRVAVIDPVNYPSQKGETPQGWTNNAIRAARDEALEHGLTPILAPHRTAAPLLFSGRPRHGRPRSHYGTQRRR